MGEIRPKTCEGRELTKDQLAETRGSSAAGVGARLPSQATDGERSELSVDLTKLGRAKLMIYLASGKAKHERYFWLHTETAEVSWGKSLRCKKCKTEKLVRVVDEPTVPDAKQARRPPTHPALKTSLKSTPLHAEPSARAARASCFNSGC